MRPQINITNSFFVYTKHKVVCGTVVCRRLLVAALRALVPPHGVPLQGCMLALIFTNTEYALNTLEVIAVSVVGQKVYALHIMYPSDTFSSPYAHTMLSAI